METLSYYQLMMRCQELEARVAELESENKKLNTDVNVYQHGYNVLAEMTKVVNHV